MTPCRHTLRGRQADRGDLPRPVDADRGWLSAGPQDDMVRVIQTDIKAAIAAICGYVARCADAESASWCCTPSCFQFEQSICLSSKSRAESTAQIVRSRTTW